MATTQRNGQLLLVAADSSLKPQLESAGFRVTTWPRLQLQPPESFAALDDAIENLYGYDWIVFVNEDSVRLFVERLDQQGYEVSDLDSLRVCAIREATATVLEQAHVHVDVISTRMNPSAIIEQLATYAGGAQSLHRLNFLLPQAVIGSDYLKGQLEEAGARADVIGAYQTVDSDKVTRLSALHSMLLTGSIDAVVFSNPDEVRQLARVFDTEDLNSLLRNMLVLTTGDATTKEAVSYGILKPIQANDVDANTVADLLTKHFRS